MTLTLITAPLVPPIELDSLRDHLGEARQGTESFHEEVDSLILEALATAVGMLDGDRGELGGAMISQVWQESFARVPPAGGCLELGLNPVRSITKVEAREVGGNWVEADLAGFELLRLDDRYHLEAATWPAVGDYRLPLRVTYEVGYGASPAEVPPNLRRAVLLLAAHFYEIREPVVLDQRPVEVPISVERLLAPYKRIWV